MLKITARQILSDKSQNIILKSTFQHDWLHIMHPGVLFQTAGRVTRLKRQQKFSSHTPPPPDGRRKIFIADGH